MEYTTPLRHNCLQKDCDGYFTSSVAMLVEFDLARIPCNRDRSHELYAPPEDLLGALQDHLTKNSYKGVPDTLAFFGWVPASED